MVAPELQVWQQRSAFRRQTLAESAFADFSASHLPLADRMPAKPTLGWYSCGYGWAALSG